MVMVIFGGNKMRSRVLTLRGFLKASDNLMSTLVSYPKILLDLRSVFLCHATGLRILSNYTHYLRDHSQFEGGEFTKQTCPSNVNEFDEARVVFMPFIK